MECSVAEVGNLGVRRHLLQFQKAHLVSAAVSSMHV